MHRCSQWQLVTCLLLALFELFIYVDDAELYLSIKPNELSKLLKLMDSSDSTVCPNLTELSEKGNLNLCRSITLIRMLGVEYIKINRCITENYGTSIL